MAPIKLNLKSFQAAHAWLSISERRKQPCLKFAKKSVKNGSLKDLFQPNTDSHHEKFHVTFAKTDRLKNSAIPLMQRLLHTK